VGARTQFVRTGFSPFTIAGMGLPWKALPSARKIMCCLVFFLTNADYLKVGQKRNEEKAVNVANKD